jgi:hypothetical protein
MLKQGLLVLMVPINGNVKCTFPFTATIGSYSCLLIPYLMSLVTTPNGVKIFAATGTTEFLKRRIPKEGDIVSFKHHGFLTSGKPKMPTIYRMRDDITWEDVVYTFKEPIFKTAGIIAVPFSFIYLSLLFHPFKN